MPILYAKVAYNDERRVARTVLTAHIKFGKRDRNAIAPRGPTDFQPEHNYYIRWRNCTEGCRKRHQHHGWYKGCILFLAESEETLDAAVAAAGRISFPNVPFEQRQASFSSNASSNDDTESLSSDEAQDRAGPSGLSANGNQNREESSSESDDDGFTLAFSNEESDSNDSDGEIPAKRLKLLRAKAQHESNRRNLQVYLDNRQRFEPLMPSLQDQEEANGRPENERAVRELDNELADVQTVPPENAANMPEINIAGADMVAQIAAPPSQNENNMPGADVVIADAAPVVPRRQVNVPEAAANAEIGNDGNADVDDDERNPRHRRRALMPIARYQVVQERVQLAAQLEVNQAVWQEIVMSTRRA